MHLAYDYPLSPVDDERPVLGYNGDFTKVDFLLFHVPKTQLARILFLLVDHEAHHNLHRVAVGHPSLAAFVHLIFPLINERFTAHLTLHPRPAEALVLSAFAFPQADFVAHILQEGGLVEIANGKDAPEDFIQPPQGSFALGHVVLEEPLIGALLDFDKVGDVDDGWDAGEAKPLAQSLVMGSLLCCHAPSPQSNKM